MTAVVVLPTPPFWLATAMIRARRPPEAARGAASGSARLTDHLLQRKHGSARIGAARMTRDVHCPGFAGGGQFFLGLRALQERGTSFCGPINRSASGKSRSSGAQPRAVTTSTACGATASIRQARRVTAAPAIRAASRKNVALRCRLRSARPQARRGSPAPARETLRRCRDRRGCARRAESAAAAAPNSRKCRRHRSASVLRPTRLMRPDQSASSAA